jgi:hypothetical protein
MLAALAWQPALFACPICFQGDPGAASDGLRAAVLVLGGVASSVVICCAAAFVRLLRRDSE